MHVATIKFYGAGPDRVAAFMTVHFSIIPLIVCVCVCTSSTILIISLEWLH